MRKEYNFDKMKGRKNPYAKDLKQQVTMRIGVDIVEYFKNLAEETGVPYQNSWEKKGKDPDGTFN